MQIASAWQYQVKHHNGQVLWTGTAIVGVMHVVKNFEPSETMAMSEAVLIRSFDSTFPRAETNAAGTAVPADLPQTLDIQVGRSNAIPDGTDLGWVGVTLDVIPPGGRGSVAGQGSIVSVRVDTPLLATGMPLGNALAGRGIAAFNPNASSSPAATFGMVLRPNDPDITLGTGSTAYCGALITTW